MMDYTETRDKLEEEAQKHQILKRVSADNEKVYRERFRSELSVFNPLFYKNVRQVFYEHKFWFSDGEMLSVRSTNAENFKFIPNDLQTFQGNAVFPYFWELLQQYRYETPFFLVFLLPNNDDDIDEETQKRANEYFNIALSKVFDLSGRLIFSTRNSITFRYDKRRLKVFNGDKSGIQSSLCVPLTMVTNKDDASTRYTMLLLPLPLFYYFTKTQLSPHS